MILKKRFLCLIICLAIGYSMDNSIWPDLKVLKGQTNEQIVIEGLKKYVNQPHQGIQTYYTNCEIISLAASNFSKTLYCKILLVLGQNAGAATSETVDEYLGIQAVSNSTEFLQAVAQLDRLMVSSNQSYGDLQKVLLGSAISFNPLTQMLFLKVSNGRANPTPWFLDKIEEQQKKFDSQSLKILRKIYTDRWENQFLPSKTNKEGN